MKEKLQVYNLFTCKKNFRFQIIFRNIKELPNANPVTSGFKQQILY
jgi:hypothetical protein